MVIKNIERREIANSKRFNKGSKFKFYEINGLIYKIADLQENILLRQEEQLKVLEERLELLEEAGVLKLEEVNGPLLKLYYDNKFVGYATHYLHEYVELVESAVFLNNYQKIELLISLSRAIKQIHRKGIVHSDIYSDNVLTNGLNVKIIDFDEVVPFREGKQVQYYNSPYADIAGVNNLVLRLLTAESFGRSKRNKYMSLPVEIKKYIKWFDNNAHQGEIRASMPTEYPHDWLNELKPYIGETGYFIRTI